MFYQTRTLIHIIHLQNVSNYLNRMHTLLDSRLLFNSLFVLIMPYHKACAQNAKQKYSVWLFHFLFFSAVRINIDHHSSVCNQIECFKLNWIIYVSLTLLMVLTNVKYTNLVIVLAKAFYYTKVTHLLHGLTIPQGKRTFNLC